MNYPIKKLSQDEKPREKIKSMGVRTLSNVELLAVLLRSGGKEMSAIDLARDLINKYEGAENLRNADIIELSQFKFINIAKASSILAGIELGLRISNNRNFLKDKSIDKPEDIANLLNVDLFGKTKEHLYLISLNARNKVIAKDLVSIGTINETLLAPREIFRQALLRNAVSIVLVHNHPSDNPNPSKEDIEITNSIRKASKELGIMFLDHVIITNSGYTSMKKLGVLVN